MLTVGLKDMHFNALHGVHAEEAILGGEFVLSIEVDLNRKYGVTYDKLSNTFNYGTLHAICTEEMMQRSELLEHVLERISGRIWKTYAREVDRLRIEIKKLNPPLGGRVGAAVVKLIEESPYADK